MEPGGLTLALKVAHLRLSHSRAIFQAAYPRESQEMMFDAQAPAYMHLGGNPRRGIYDNDDGQSIRNRERLVASSIPVERVRACSLNAPLLEIAGRVRHH